MAIPLDSVGFVVPIPKGLCNAVLGCDLRPGFLGRAMKHQQIAALGLQFQPHFLQGPHDETNPAILGVFEAVQDVAVQNKNPQNG